MKSIREKVQTDYPKSDILEEEMTRICYRVGFEKGANYVLDHLSKTIAVSDDSYLLSNLKKLILQLKK